MQRDLVALNAVVCPRFGAQKPGVGSPAGHRTQPPVFQGFSGTTHTAHLSRTETSFFCPFFSSLFLGVCPGRICPFCH